MAPRARMARTTVPTGGQKTVIIAPMNRAWENPPTKNERPSAQFASRSPMVVVSTVWMLPSRCSEK